MAAAGCDGLALCPEPPSPCGPAGPELLSPLLTDLELDTLEEFARGLLDELATVDPVESAEAAEAGPGEGARFGRGPPASVVGPAAAEHVDGGGGAAAPHGGCSGGLSAAAEAESRISTITEELERCLAGTHAQRTHNVTARHQLQPAAQSTTDRRRPVARRAIQPAPARSKASTTSRRIQRGRKPRSTDSRQDLVSVLTRPSTTDSSECSSLLGFMTDDVPGEQPCIAIVVPGSDSGDVPIGEQVTEVCSTSLRDFLTTYKVEPEDVQDEEQLGSPTHLSDYGYESGCSPRSDEHSCDHEMSQLWNQSVTELFPALM